MMLFRQTLGAALRARRLSQGRILTDVARAAHISPSYLSEVERGKREASSELLDAICGALGVTYRVTMAAASPSPGSAAATGTH